VKATSKVKDICSYLMLVVVSLWYWFVMLQNNHNNSACIKYRYRTILRQSISNRGIPLRGILIEAFKSFFQYMTDNRQEIDRVYDVIIA
jgi:hypothetical protein